MTAVASLPEVTTDPLESARAAGLRYVSDTSPGIRRAKRGDSWRYLAPDGSAVADDETLGRIKSLAIPPAWTDVWICPNPRGHIQATGRDAKGRKQYRYHPKWRSVRDDTKYFRMIAFGEALPLIRARTSEDLSRPGLPREKVLAALVQLLETTLIRVGNEEYARTNKSFGLTTMRDRHVDVSTTKVEFVFKGKSGKKHAITLRDRRLANVVKRCRDIPGQELFQYIDEAGERQSVDSADVNDYLREITGQEFTAKDFRTWAGTVLAALALQEFETFDSETQAKKNIVQAIQSVAERLGNTPAICRKCYIHPAVMDSYLEGTMLDALQQRTEEWFGDACGDLRPEEAAVMALLRRRLKAEQERDLARDLEKSVRQAKRDQRSPRRGRASAAAAKRSSAGPRRSPAGVSE